MNLMKTDWKKIERSFAQHVGTGYRSMWGTLLMKFDDLDDETIDDFRKVEHCAKDHGAKNYIAELWEDEKTLMEDLANHEPEFVQRTADWLMAKSFPKLLAHHVHGLREMKGLNRKIAKIFKQLSKRPQDDTSDKLKEKMANLKKLASDQSVVLACLDHKLEDVPKIKKKTKIVLSKMAQVTIKVMKSFRRKRSERNSENSDAENGGSSDDVTLKEEHRSRSLASTSSQALDASNKHDSPRTEDLRETGDSAPQGDGPRPAGSFPKIIMVKPLDESNEDDDFDRQAEFEENISDVKKEIRQIDVDRNGPETDRREQGKTDHGEELVHTAPQATKASPVDNLPGMVRKFAWSEEPTPIPEVTNTSTDQAVEELETKATPEDASGTKDPKPLSEMFEIYVRVVKKYKAKNKYEMSLKVGQIIKQKCHANQDGYGYGWTRAHRLAPKRWGMYPMDCVQLKSKGKQ